MRSLISAYRFLNLVSIDVACGAMICACFFAGIFQVQLRIYGIAAMGISVWIIYTMDHLLDARQLQRKASTERHLFHQRYFKLLSLLVVIAGLIDMYLVMNIRWSLLSWGLCLAGVVTIYLLIQRWISPFKEIVGAFLYSTGVLLPALSLQENLISMPTIFIMIVFFFTAFINLTLFSMFDVENDQKQTQSSLVTSYGQKVSKAILCVVFIIQAILCFELIIVSIYTIETFILILMNIVLVILFIVPDRFRQMQRYRLLGDIIFLFPLPYLVLNDWI